MEFKDTLNKLTGRLTIRVIDRDGNVVSEEAGNNLIVNSGYNAAAQAMSGVAGAAIAKVGIGTNATLPAGTDKVLTSPFIVNVDSIDYPGDAIVRFNFTIPYEVANGMIIAEYGLITADGRLFARRVRERVTKTQFLMIVGMWEINL